MKMVICSIWDSKAEVFSQPMFFQAKGQAVRSFSDAVNEEGNFKKHPEDFTLFVLGEFDDNTGLISAQPPETLGNGVQYVTSPLSLVKGS